MGDRLGGRLPDHSDDELQLAPVPFGQMGQVLLHRLHGKKAPQVGVKYLPVSQDEPSQKNQKHRSPYYCGYQGK